MWNTFPPQCSSAGDQAAGKPRVTNTWVAPPSHTPFASRLRAGRQLAAASREGAEGSSHRRVASWRLLQQEGYVGREIDMDIDDISD